MAGQYGPLDYRTEKAGLVIVEIAHFTPKVEMLIAGERSANVGGDLDYTLRASPNHHRALLAMVNLVARVGNNKPPGANYSVDCYFDRAIRFAKDDVVVRMIFASFLAKSNRNAQALQQLEQAVGFAGDNPFSHYNIGLVYFDLKEYDKALKQAHQAMSLGFLRTELREQLIAVGRWTEPVSRAASESSSPTESGVRKD